MNPEQPLYDHKPADLLASTLKVEVISKDLKQKLRYYIKNGNYQNSNVKQSSDDPSLLSLNSTAFSSISVKETLKQLSYEEIFDVFDDDDSGLISFDEFRKLLPYLGITVNDAKAYRYFRLCDIDGSGQIDVDEFKVVLFLCDPSSGNQVGYTPKQYVTPLDAFELFDEDHSGDMDEDEFAYAMEYLGMKSSDNSQAFGGKPSNSILSILPNLSSTLIDIKLTDGEIEKLFNDCDVDKSGKIEYEEFRDIFIKVCDAKSELLKRGVDVPLFSKISRLRQLLREAVLDEEKREQLAVAETLKYKIWISSIKDKRIFVERAKFRAYHEFRRALDLSGQVYVFGNGSNGQFSGKAASKLQSSTYVFEDFEAIINMWSDRVRPSALVEKLRLSRKTDQLERIRELNRKKRRGEYFDENLYSADYILDPHLEAKASLFTKLNAAVNTAGLYGRRVIDVAISESVMFALSDTGEIFTWYFNCCSYSCCDS
jgi:Ca2+-binding EF-hand superfamily protein